MQPEYLLLLMVVFAFLLIFAAHISHDEKRVLHAQRILNIPIKYTHHFKHLLSSIYKNHPYMYRVGDLTFVQLLKEQQPNLYQRIVHELQVKQRIELMISHDKLHPYLTQFNLL